MSICNNSGLGLFIPDDSNIWDLQKINHLYRRVAFGISPKKTNTLLLKSPSEVVDQLVDESLSLELPPGPDWMHLGNKELPNRPGALRRLMQRSFVGDCQKSTLHQRMVMFWMNHFVIEIQNLSPQYSAQYLYEVVYPNALGNFKDFVHKVGISSAMLVYLNGNQNKKQAPNENYARELYELFTLGVDNGYTQNDIVETARALTGYTLFNASDNTLVFRSTHFDTGEKEIFGQVGNWGYDDVIRILFETHSLKIARFICKKLYAYFVSPDVNDTIVEQLASTFVDNDFEIIPVLKQLFKSQHFFDEATRGVLIKSPVDIQISLIVETASRYKNAGSITTHFASNAGSTGQNILNPPDVSGWQGDLNWITSNYLVIRWEYMKKHLKNTSDYSFNPYVNFVKALFPVNTTDARMVSRGIIDYFIAQPLSDESEYDEGFNYFASNVPESYFEDGTWDLGYPEIGEQVVDLLGFIVQMPEFQLK